MQAQPERAVRLAGAAAVLRKAVGAPLSPFEQTKVQQTLDLAHHAMPLPDFTSAWAKGQAFTPEEAMLYAIENGFEA